MTSNTLEIGTVAPRITITLIGSLCATLSWEVSAIYTSLGGGGGGGGGGANYL